MGIQVVVLEFGIPTCEGWFGKGLLFSLGTVGSKQRGWLSVKWLDLAHSQRLIEYKQFPKLGRRQYPNIFLNNKMYPPIIKHCNGQSQIFPIYKIWRWFSHSNIAKPSLIGDFPAMFDDIPNHSPRDGPVTTHPHSGASMESVRRLPPWCGSLKNISDDVGWFLINMYIQPIYIYIYIYNGYIILYIQCIIMIWMWVKMEDPVDHRC